MLKKPVVDFFISLRLEVNSSLAAFFISSPLGKFRLWKRVGSEQRDFRSLERESHRITDSHLEWIA